jgi:hypothetical protein
MNSVPWQLPMIGHLVAPVDPIEEREGNEEPHRGEHHRRTQWAEAERRLAAQIEASGGERHDRRHRYGNRYGCLEVESAVVLDELLIRPVLDVEQGAQGDACDNRAKYPSP